VLPSAHQYISDICPLVESISVVKAIVRYCVPWPTEAIYCLIRAPYRAWQRWGICRV